jgi:hypothetical protein
MDQPVKVWFDATGDFMAVVFSDAPGWMIATDDDAVIKRVGADGRLLGFSTLGVSKRALERRPLEATLNTGDAA